MDIYSALADPTRRDIVELLAENGEMSASEIYEKFSTTPPAVSQHLKVLRESEILEVEKQAQKRIYKINTQTLHEVEDWLTKINKNWEDRFNRLEGVLNNG